MARFQRPIRFRVGLRRAARDRAARFVVGLAGRERNQLRRQALQQPDDACTRLSASNVLEQASDVLLPALLAELGMEPTISQQHDAALELRDEDQEPRVSARAIEAPPPRTTEMLGHA